MRISGGGASGCLLSVPSTNVLSRTAAWAERPQTTWAEMSAGRSESKWELFLEQGGHMLRKQTTAVGSLQVGALGCPKDSLVMERQASTENQVRTTHWPFTWSTEAAIVLLPSSPPKERPNFELLMSYSLLPSGTQNF